MADHWTAEQDAALLNLRQEDGLTFPEIASRFPDKSDSACRNRYRYITKVKGQAENGFVSQGNTPTSALEQWQLQTEKPGWREIIDVAHMAADLQHRTRPLYNLADRVIHTKQPIFVVLMSDFHLGAPAFDALAFLRTTDLLLSDPRFYFIIVGPDIETAFAWFRSADAVLDQTIPPWLQLEGYRQWLDEMLIRALATCGDNHTDQRLERMLGEIGLTWRTDLPYFRANGILTVRLDDGQEPVDYRIVLAHKYNGHSIYHKLQPTLRMFREIDPLADIYATAHTHAPFYLNGVYWPDNVRSVDLRQHFAVAGTFKTGLDVYGMRGFGKPGVIGLPTFMLYPGEKEIVHFASPEQALRIAG